MSEGYSNLKWGYFPAKRTASRKSSIGKTRMFITLQVDFNLSRFSFLTFRGSHQRCFVKTGALRYFTKFTGKHLFQRLFLYSCRPLTATLLKRVSVAGVF